MIESIFVENLRSFRKRTTIRLAPLTVFIGQNSAGKSSITRLIPLLKQSQEQRTASLLLWNSSYVDFGSFDDVLSRGAHDEPLRIGFHLSGSALDRSIADESPVRDYPEAADYRITYELELGRGSRGRTRARRAILRLDDDVVELQLNLKGEVARVLLNDQPLGEVASAAKLMTLQSGVVPSVYMVGMTRYGEEGVRFGNRLAQIIAAETEHSISNATARQFARQLYYRPSRLFRHHVLELWRTLDPALANASAGFPDKLFEKLRLHALGRDLSRITRSISEMISTEIGLSQYIGPIRSHAERYYRIQELAIDHIDPRGENVAMYLHFLSSSQLRSFNELFGEALGYTVHPVSTKGHVSLMIKEKGRANADNIADVGFGFSQVLPVIAQLFAATATSDAFSFPRRLPRSKDIWPIIAVEQPELHLHPAYQAKLADLFANLLNRKVRRQYRYIVETHSEALVNRLGLQIASGKLSSADVAIYTFVKDDSAPLTSVNELHYNSDGVIEDWPVGFFAAR